MRVTLSSREELAMVDFFDKSLVPEFHYTHSDTQFPAVHAFTSLFVMVLRFDEQD